MTSLYAELYPTWTSRRGFCTNLSIADSDSADPRVFRQLHRLGYGCTFILCKDHRSTKPCVSEHKGIGRVLGGRSGAVSMPRTNNMAHSIFWPLLLPMPLARRGPSQTLELLAPSDPAQCATNISSTCKKTSFLLGHCLQSSFAKDVVTDPRGKFDSHHQQTARYIQPGALGSQSVIHDGSCIPSVHHVAFAGECATRVCGCSSSLESCNETWRICLLW